MNGIGNRLTGQAEQAERRVILKEWTERVQAKKRVPGTHTLGKAFQTVEPTKDKANANRVKEPVSLT